ncbi:hypothetical protein ACFQV2_12830 [Actinokineospora soli]|uniref:Uncharacterized protein n=1 Tax=Actinokineospora soli TaxID=1048753 RepID=A0ABW2TKK7_9PSEU
MATPLDVLRKIPTVIAVAVGGEKVTGIRVGARAGFHRAPKHPSRAPRAWACSRTASGTR